MNTKRCLLVDDESHAIATLQRMLVNQQGIEVVGHAHSVASAREACLALRPDLILLDVKLGDGSGFDLLAVLEVPPAVIFTTAYDEHAVRAFEVNALDYLLKPVEEERLKEALDRADRRAQAKAVSGQAASSSQLVDSKLIELGSTGRFVAPESISFIQADDKYTRIQMVDGSEILTQTSLTDWQRRLEAFDFVRLDRQWLVGLAVVHSVDFIGREAQVKIHKPNVNIRVGRTGAARLRQVLRGRSH
jgi:two-component system LytT family response regulator